MDSHRTNSLVPYATAAVLAVLTFAAAAHAVRLGRNDSASKLLAALDDAELRAHYESAAGEWRRRNKLAPRPVSAGPVVKDAVRLPGPSGQREVFARDGWHCRWCATPVIALDGLKTMALTLPSAFPHGKLVSECHGLTLACAASLDHVVPHSTGGSNEPSNLVTACWSCQFGRGSDAIERLWLNDPRDRHDPPLLVGWDGCAWFT